jgi:hypothetical protein
MPHNWLDSGVDRPGNVTENVLTRSPANGMLWTDDYLAAFAQASDATLTTLDRKMPARYPSVRVELLLP